MFTEHSTNFNICGQKLARIYLNNGNLANRSGYCYIVFSWDIISGNPSYFPAPFLISLLSHSPHSASFPSPYFSFLPSPSTLLSFLPSSLLASFSPPLLLFFFFQPSFLPSFRSFSSCFYLLQSLSINPGWLWTCDLLLSPLNSRFTDVYYHNCSVIFF